MKTYLECIPCFVHQSLDAARMATEDRDARLSIIRRVLEAAARFPEDTPPPVMGAQIHRIVREESGSPDPYRQVKERANSFALDMLPQLREKVKCSKDPFETALRLAIGGNIMDWGAKPHTDLSEDVVRETMRHSLDAPLHGETARELHEHLSGAEDILYLADNAGEIALDRLFIEFLPCDEVMVAVKSGPIINDATMEDARQVGLAERARMVETGDNTPGTVLGKCSQGFRGRFAGAEVIIAKGQGNYEALSERTENIVFLLKAKCPVVARHVGCKVGDMVLLHGGVSETIGPRAAQEAEDARI